LPNYKTILVLVSLSPVNDRSNIIFSYQYADGRVPVDRENNGCTGGSRRTNLTDEPAYEEILVAETFYGAFLKKMTQEPNVRLSTQWYNTFSPVFNDIDQLLF